MAGRFPKLLDWESGKLQPTLRQLERFARAVHVPIGYLFSPARDGLGVEMLSLNSKRPRRIRRGQLPTGIPTS
ncbi:MAG: hypothetical protein L0H75_06800 [Nitrosospira sp.]|nr:hypothetical protein [Nitrosospira sp.]